MRLEDLERIVDRPAPLDCEVCFGINPLVTTHIDRDGVVTGRTDIPYALCGATTEENERRREELCQA